MALWQAEAIKSVIAAMAGVFMTGCTSGFTSFSQPSGVPVQMQGPLTLTFRYPENVPVRYAFKFTMKSTGSDRSNEASEGAVYFLNEGALGDEFNRLRIRRQETSRKRVEVSRGVQTIDNSLNDIFIQLSPNIIRQDPADARFTFPVDNYGRFGVRDESPYHYLFYDSLCYFLPALSRKGAAVGEEWSARIPVILGFRYVSNEFTIEAPHKIEEVLGLPNGHKAARIKFIFSGSFDTAGDKYATRFTDYFRSGQRIVNKVEGSGSVLFDMDIGLILWKDISFRVTESHSSEKTRKTGEKDGRASSATEWETTETVYDVREAWKYVSPDEALQISK